MKKIQKLKLCNWCLLPITIAMLVSGIQLEATGSRGITSVWIHIAIGIIFAVLICYHIFLHFGKSNWFKKFSKQKKPCHTHPVVGGARHIHHRYRVNRPLGAIIHTRTHWWSAWQIRLSHDNPVDRTHLQTNKILQTP